MKLLIFILCPLTAVAGFFDRALERDADFFYEAHELTRAFDADREAGVPMARSESYRTLQDLRVRWETHQHLLLAAVAQEKHASERARFHRSLTRSLLARLTHANLIDHLISATLVRDRSVGGFPSALTAEAARAAYENHRGDLERESLKYRRPRFFSPLSPHPHSHFSPRAAFLSSIDMLAAFFRPGTGPEGNINGGSFPEKTWALTFDDGPNDVTSPQIIDTFIAAKRNLTFFHLAEMALKNPEVVAKSKAAGFALENHSFTHEKLTAVTASVRRHEIIDSTTELTKLYGQRPTFFRLPYGAGVNDKTLRRMIADQRMIHVFWNVDSLDWSDKNPESVLRRVRTDMGRLKKGVVLYHDIHPTTVATVGLLLKYLEALEGSPGAVRLVTLPQIVMEMNSRKGL